MNEHPPIWQYKVIHINVEGDAATTNLESASPQPGGLVNPQFTKSYLEQEFPGYYCSPVSHGPPASGSPASQHPAKQLEAFLNNHGRVGWVMVGIFPLGTLLMMILQRPAAAALLFR
jgi:hypothetical protein